MTEKTPHIVWSPQEGPQKALVDCPFSEVFFGGARGGGKTSGVLGKWAIKEQKYGKNFNAVMFRRTTVSAEDAIEESRRIYGALGGKFNEAKLRWRMPNGGRVAFAYLESIHDAGEYMGRNLTDAWIEEVGQYPDPAPIFRLFGVLRSAQGVPTQMILTGNPGGPGQHWICNRYKLAPFPKKPLMIVRTNEDGEEHKIAVIPSRVTDNKLLLNADPKYLSRLKLVGSPALVKAWLEGDWTAIEGAYFDCWDPEQHVLEPFTIPEDWLRFRSMDWGSAKPFSIGWWAVASDDHWLTTKRFLPRGSMIRYREWYGASEPNVGLKLTIEEVAQGIKEREAADKGADGRSLVSYGVLDPSAFISDGGPSFAERFLRKGILFRKADNKRLPRHGQLGGWDQMRARLKGENGVPLLYTFRTCVDSIRTIPVLQHDVDKPEDLDTEGEDHAADEWRYACMSRPYMKVIQAAKKPAMDYYSEGGQAKSDLTFDQLRDRQAKRRVRED